MKKSTPLPLILCVNLSRPLADVAGTIEAGLLKVRPVTIEVAQKVRAASNNPDMAPAAIVGSVVTPLKKAAESDGSAAEVAQQTLLILGFAPPTNGKYDSEAFKKRRDVISDRLRTSMKAAGLIDKKEPKEAAGPDEAVRRLVESILKKGFSPAEGKEILKALLQGVNDVQEALQACDSHAKALTEALQAAKGGSVSAKAAK